MTLRGHWLVLADWPCNPKELIDMCPSTSLRSRYESKLFFETPSIFYWIIKVLSWNSNFPYGKVLIKLQEWEILLKFSVHKKTVKIKRRDIFNNSRRRIYTSRSEYALLYSAISVTVVANSKNSKGANHAVGICWII